MLYNKTATWVASCKYMCNNSKRETIQLKPIVLLEWTSERTNTTEAATHSSNKKDVYKRNAQASKNQTNEKVPLDTFLAGSFQQAY